MGQRIDGENHQITQNGDIINCHGGTTCPFRDAPESQRQAEFAKATGIWCPRGARELFERLMSNHGFTAPGLQSSWVGNNLVWDEDSRALRTKTYWIEVFFGYSLVGIFSLFFFLVALSVVLAEAGGGWRGVATFASAMAAYAWAVWYSVRYILMPHRVAKRVRAVLEGNRQ